MNDQAPARRHLSRDAAQLHWRMRADEVKARVPIEDVIHAVLPLKNMGKGGNKYACCPFHGEKDASFAVNVKKKFFHCYGCGVNGDVIRFVMLKQDLSFTEAVQLLESRHAIDHIASTPMTAPEKPSAPQAEDAERLRRSISLWDGAQRLTPDSPVTQYLLRRAIVRPSEYGLADAKVNDGWPVDIRFVPRCWHELEKREFPAMVAPIRGAGSEILTLHRTFLARDDKGCWGKAPVDKVKLVIGSYGPGFIWLGEAADKMLGGEGIETTLSAMQLWKRPGVCYVTGGRMKSMEPPFAASHFIIAADKGSKPGKPAWGEIFAKQGASLFTNSTRTVEAKIPTLDQDKGDYNDLVQAMARRANAVRDGVAA
jgi:hypothetical protein